MEGHLKICLQSLLVVEILHILVFTLGYELDPGKIDYLCGGTLISSRSAEFVF